MADKHFEQGSEPMHGLNAAWGDGFAAASEAYQNWLASCAACSAEGARFLSQRLQRDFELPARLASCSSPTDVVRVQSEFVQQMVTDYVEEARRMQSLMYDSMANGLEPKDHAQAGSGRSTGQASRTSQPSVDQAH